jgi:hypothetical protein
MKKIFLLSTGILASTILFAQTEVRNPDGSHYKQCVRFAETEPLWKIAQENPGYTPLAHVQEASDEPAHKRALISKANPNQEVTDGALQTVAGTKENKAPLLAFDGASGQGYVPLDPNGMIGSNYYVQTVNSTYAVWNKTGTAKLAETALTKLFGSFTSDDGDPVTMYDKFADRWIVTEFQAGTGSNIDTMMFAVSQTNDPTGKYYLYYFCYDNSETSDYPKYTVWADGYYQTCNCSPSDYVVVYDRTNMLKGVKTAGYIAIPYNYSPFAAGCGGGFYCPQTLDADGTLPPYGYPCYLFDFEDPNWGSSCAAANDIRVFSVSVNWTSKTGTITQTQTLTTSAFNSTFPGDASQSTYRHDIDQPGSANYASLDVSDGFFSYRIPYLRWGTYNSALMCNVVNVGTNSTSGSAIAGVRWYELRQDTTTKQWSVYQQSTYAPSDNVSRWVPAIAMDQNGSIGLQYSVSDPTSTYPGIRYTGRTSCDPLNTMTLAEGTAATGNKDANTSLRWGDYSHLSVDPTDGITFWGTSMYASSTAKYSSYIISRIYTFQIPKCPSLGVADVSTPETELSAYQSGSMLNVKAVKVPENAAGLVVDLFDIQGKRITYKNVTESSGTVETSFNVSSLARGIYYVRIINDEFQRVIKVAIN